MLEQLFQEKIWQRNDTRTMIFPVKITSAKYSSEERSVVLERKYNDDHEGAKGYLDIRLFGYIFREEFALSLQEHLEMIGYNSNHPHNAISVFGRQRQSSKEDSKFSDYYSIYAIENLKGTNISVKNAIDNTTYNSSLHKYVWHCLKNNKVYLSVNYKRPKVPVEPFYFVESAYIEIPEDRELVVKTVIQKLNVSDLNLSAGNSWRIIDTL